MEMKLDIENMTINEYLEYKAVKKRQLWDDVRSRRSLTKYDEADFDSFQQNKSSTFNYLYSHNLPPPHPCSLHVQSYPKSYFVSTNVRNNVDIECMTIAEYNIYVAKQSLRKNPLNNHSYGFTPQFFAQPPHTTNIPDSIGERDGDLEEDQEEDVDDGDIFYMWNITVKDVERIRQFLTPNVLDVMDDIIQPLIPKTIHTTPPDEDYVAPTTKSILDDLFEEFRYEILNVTMVDEGVECSHTKDLEELERLLAKDPQSYYT
ncbi:hypothetical protein Tco_1422536 [Tanacetum coccineum]